ncbi:MAG: hypothetical protein U1E46_10330 [Hyphomicrobiales bacterium]
MVFAVSSLGIPDDRFCYPLALLGIWISQGGTLGAFQNGRLYGNPGSKFYSIIGAILAIGVLGAVTTSSAWPLSRTLFWLAISAFACAALAAIGLVWRVFLNAADVRSTGTHAIDLYASLLSLCSVTIIAGLLAATFAGWEMNRGAANAVWGVVILLFCLAVYRGAVANNHPSTGWSTLRWSGLIALSFAAIAAVPVFFFKRSAFPDLAPIWFVGGLGLLVAFIVWAALRKKD